MRFSNVIMSILLLGSVLVGLFAFATDLGGEDKYNAPVDDSYLSQFDKTDNLTSEISEKYDEIQNFSTKKSSAYQIITLVPDALSLVKNIIVLPFTLIGELIHSLTTVLQLPEWASIFMKVAITIMFLFAFIALILRYKDT